MRRLDPVIRRALRGSCRLPAGSRVLVAVSGGADSTALLIGLRRLAPEFGLSLQAAHLHHGLRGAEADADLAFVAALCRRLDVPLQSAVWNTRLRMRRRRLSGQDGLRTLRREFLIAAARRCGAVAIATGHTADDQLETVLLRLLRGTGLAGLGGISARRGRWIRPLLEASRSDVEADLGALGQAWREDRSNLDPGYARNRVRHDLVPAMLRAQGGAQTPEARAALAKRVGQSARDVRSARRTLEAEAERALPRVARIEGGEIALDSRGLRSYPSAIRRTVLRRLWKRFGHASEGLTRRHVEAIEGLLASPRGGARVDLPENWLAERDQRLVRLRRMRPKGMQRRPSPASPRSLTLTMPGRRRWSGCLFEGRWLSGDRARRGLCARRADEEYFAAEAVEGELQLRRASSDESFVPFGSRRPRRLGEFLSKQRAPRPLRAAPLVLADQGGILWVIGARRSARAPITPATRKALWIHAELHD